MTDNVMSFFAAWMLTHEVADEGLKAAVLRGEDGGPEGMGGGPDAFVNGLAAMVAEEKEKLKRDLEARARGEEVAIEQQTDPAFEELRFEVGELRGRLDNIEGLLETLVRKSGS
ncbi:MAG: hypothetical protein Q8S43_02905 [Actinomycetota bacterium]|nr:MAG: hypothetical protein FD171_2067 [Actinomycetota bacterium]MDO8950114.1 hypothetical protein [Actinomycetota bacterium]MDP3629891.1 hypothetical protein [Actinomycetota bacterium]